MVTQSIKPSIKPSIPGSYDDDFLVSSSVSKVDSPGSLTSGTATATNAAVAAGHEEHHERQLPNTAATPSALTTKSIDIDDKFHIDLLSKKVDALGLKSVSEHDVIPMFLLRGKMLASLSAMKKPCSPKEHKTVAKLVEDNTVTARFLGSDVPWVLSEINQILYDVNQFLLNLKPRLSRINTNELVLLLAFDDSPRYLNNFGCVGGMAMGAAKWKSQVEWIKEEVLVLLDQTCNLRPVRVYIVNEDDMLGGLYDPDDMPPRNKYNAFSITFLNVVNTDIGGPSMIELLDHDSAGAQWQVSVALAEARQDYHLLWKSHLLWMANSFKDDVPAKVVPTIALGTSDRAEGEDRTSSQASNKSIPDILHEDEQVMVPAEHSEQFDATPEDRVTKSKDRGIDGPDPASIEPTPVYKSDILHPTWQHVDADSSLIDLVSIQASQISDTGSDAEIVDRDEAALGLPKDAEDMRSDDGFQLV